MVVTHFVFVGRGVTGATVSEAAVIVIADVVAVVTGGWLFVTVATGLARVVWISALLARAVLSFSLICSIWSCSSCSSPGWGGTTVMVGVVTVDGVTVAGDWDIATEGGAKVLGLAEEEDGEGSERTRLANEAGPPFSHSWLFETFSLVGPPTSDLAPDPLMSEVAMRASRRRVLRVSRLKWTRLKSRVSLAAVASLLVSLFHLAEAPGAGGEGGPGGG